MPHIELPRALEEYFAFAETEPTRRGRRFSITLPYRNGERMERLQWWYHVTPAEELMYEGHGLATLRARAIVRFRAHIERWLELTKQRLHGDEAIPRLSAHVADAHVANAHVANAHVADAPSAKSEPTAPWPLRQIAS